MRPPWNLIRWKTSADYTGANYNPRRVLDRGQDLWTTFNVVQENVIRGGIRGRTEKGKMTRTREVTGIDGDIKLNQVLWKMAEEFAKLKA